jgi:hypothetical protein
MSHVLFAHFRQDNEGFLKFLTDIEPAMKENGYEEVFEKYKLDKILGARKYAFKGEHIGSFTCQFIALNDWAMLATLKEKLKTQVSEHTATNFMFLAEALLHPGNHCVLSSISGTSRIELCRLFAQTFNYKFVDLTRSCQFVRSACLHSD